MYWTRIPSLLTRTCPWQRYIYENWSNMKTRWHFENIFSLKSSTRTSKVESSILQFGHVHWCKQGFQSKINVEWHTQCRSWWDGSWRAVSSLYTLFAHASVLVCRAEKVNKPPGTYRSLWDGEQTLLYLTMIYQCKTTEPEHDKTYKKTSATSEVLDQPGHPRSLIRVFADRMRLLQPPGYSKKDKREPLAL